MNELELALQSAGLLDLVRKRAEELGTTLVDAIRQSMATKVEEPSEKTFAQWKQEAEVFAGRQVSDSEVCLFKRFGTTNLSEVSMLDLYAWEEELDASG